MDLNLSIDELLTQLGSDDAEERLFALVYIARLNVQQALVDVTFTLAYDADHEVRSTAAWALDLLGNPAAIPALVRALEDDDYHVRSTAGWALSHMGDYAIPHVVHLLRTNNNVDARNMAYQILSRSDVVAAQDAINTYWQ